MKDTIITGNGLSRSIKAPANLKQQVTDLDSLLDLLIAGLPCDIGPLNEAGCQQIGDALNKANLLKDVTAALYGLTGEAVLDEVLAKARELIANISNVANAKSYFEHGEYTGVGNKTKTLSFSFLPQILLVMQTNVNNGNFLLYTRGIKGILSFYVSYFGNASPSTQYGFPVTLSGNSISWTGDNAASAMNYSGYTYAYFCIG